MLPIAILLPSLKWHDLQLVHQTPTARAEDRSQIKSKSGQEVKPRPSSLVHYHDCIVECLMPHIPSSL